MNKLFLLIRHQWTEWARNRLLYAFAGIISLLWLFGLYTGMRWYQDTNRLRDKATTESRHQWLHQDRKHPHIAAHFGNFAFKHPNPLSIIDQGTDAFTGTYVYMEAHRQNDVLFSPAQNTSPIERLGNLTIAMLLQLLVPLLLFILTFNTVLAERRQGTLALVKASGVSGRTYVLAKILALWIITMLLIVLLYAGTLALLAENGIRLNGEEHLKAALLLFDYAAYYLIIITIGTGVSALAHSMKQSLLILLSGWMLAGIILPKLAGNVADALYPLPSNTQYKEAVSKDITNGIDGHNTSDNRAKALTDALLKKYGVDSTSQLPVNIEGVVMLAGERYSSGVYNRHIARLNATVLKQQRLFSYLSLIDPLLAIKHVSMGLTNTDSYNDQDFRSKAEAYRMNFVQLMNQDMALHSKESEFGTYKIGAEIFNRITPFTFRPQNAWQSLGHYLPEVLFLGLLTVLSLLSVSLIAQRI